MSRTEKRYETAPVTACHEPSTCVMLTLEGVSGPLGSNAGALQVDIAAFAQMARAGARLEWIEPTGDEVVRTFWLWPRGDENATRVPFSFGPGLATRFDCARLREAGPLFVDPRRGPDGSPLEARGVPELRVEGARWRE